jgi:uncharacterized protein YecT (DUF1311 family)
MAAHAQIESQPACMDSAETQADMNICAGRLFRWSDGRLQRLLVALADAGLSDPLPPLSEVQVKWEHFRNAQCSWERDLYRGGSMTSMVNALCLAGLTERRIDELKGFLCGMGGGTCAESRIYDLKDDSN